MAEQTVDPFATATKPIGRYEDNYNAHDHHHDDQLPEYEPSNKAQSRSNTVVERVFTLDTSSKGKSWAFLKINTRRTGSGLTPSAQSTPNFFQGDLITGTVEVEIEKSDSFVAITLEVRGESLAVGQEPVTFYSESVGLWSLNSPSTSTGPISNKFKGHYVWPYSVKLPERVTVPQRSTSTSGNKGSSGILSGSGDVESYSLPPSFTERASPAYLEYKIIVTFKRGFLKPNSTLVTPFAYFPRITPPTCSYLRQLAYQDNTAPPPPKIDPEGWHDLGTKLFTGIVFETRQVDISLAFFLAKPLSYTRGTFIPFSLALSCADMQALDLLTARGSLNIKLKRTLYVGSTAMQGNLPAGSSTTASTNGKRTDTSFEITVGEGVYWTAEDNVPNSETRRLEGEISLKADLKPTFVFPNVTVRYAVRFELAMPGLVVLSNNGVAPFYEQAVEIAILKAPGPVPRSRSATALLLVHGGEGQSSGNYDVSIGVLTQANQRFLHLGHHGLS